MRFYKTSFPAWYVSYPTAEAARRWHWLWHGLLRRRLVFLGMDYLLFVGKRRCLVCNNKLQSLEGHSAGTMHMVCTTCNFCPDCYEGEQP